ncbi:MAG: Kelch repeat-containing protein [Candidatus Kariarchaeaceae archaeon]
MGSTMLIFSSPNESDEVPSVRAGHKMVYNEETGKMILFGGNTNPLNENDDLLLDDTWTYDLTTDSWELLTPDISPSPRFEHSMIYDPKNRRTLLFGGYGGNTQLNDLWQYDQRSNTWTEIIVPTTPAEIDSTAMIFDPEKERILQFGGFGTIQNKIDDLWAFYLSNSSWVKILSNPHPTARYGHTMEYEPKSRTAILFGGNDQNYVKLDDTWIFHCSNDSWKKLEPNTKPTARYAHAMIHDPVNAKMIIYGGLVAIEVGYKSDGSTWLYDYSANDWEDLQTSTPPSRFSTTMVYHPIEQKAILFGGISGVEEDDVTLNDLWTLNLAEDDIYWVSNKSNDSFLGLQWFYILSALLVPTLLKRSRFKI